MRQAERWIFKIGPLSTEIWLCPKKQRVLPSPFFKHLNTVLVFSTKLYTTFAWHYQKSFVWHYNHGKNWFTICKFNGILDWSKLFFSPFNKPARVEGAFFRVIAKLVQWHTTYSPSFLHDKCQKRNPDIFGFVKGGKKNILWQSMIGNNGIM